MNDFFLADDLSGALEAAAAFHDAGRRVRIALTPEAALAAAPGDVIGFTTETRNATPAAAADRVAQVLARAREHARGGRFLCKKIDSTLRGPVAAELGVLAAKAPRSRILFCPANPRVGRTVRDGILRVRGAPVAETEFARDPAHPVRTSVIRDLLGAAATARVLIPDIETEADLAAAVARMRREDGDDWIAIGSGALARAVAGTLVRPAAAVVTAAEAVASPPIRAVAPSAAPVLFVCGSAHPVNEAQALHWQRHTHATAHLVVPGADNTTAIAAAAAELRSGAWSALRLAARAAQGSADSTSALTAICAAAHAVVTASGVRRVLLTGGETAFAFCAALGIHALEVEGELEPGLVLASARVGGNTWRCAIKPGGFGSEAAWVLAGTRLAALA